MGYAAGVVFVINLLKGAGKGTVLHMLGVGARGDRESGDMARIIVSAKTRKALISKTVFHLADCCKQLMRPLVHIKIR